MDKININDKFNLFSDHWTPKIVADLNDSHIKLAKFKGEFVWHKHDNEDELFMVIKGDLTIKFRDKEVQVSPGEFIVIPKGIEHLPIAKDEVHVILIEPKSTLNTGDTDSDLTVSDLDRI
ncbi:MAG: mannose-6-phosphate isomerase [Legionellales bacterium]|nr:mannose-6-phosphate isomerase [Legionellales bacterium]|tara:strand:+ start:84612 stop:84971 length:360 start_codon:yes stop_codon:yes gene_type:complete